VNDNDRLTRTILARVGISISMADSNVRGWGWTIQNSKIIHDWQGPYPTPAAAMEGALSWLLEHARKGLLCHHLHPPASDRTTVPLDTGEIEPNLWYNLN
jgi:isoleucyl-tRNA synthetase